MDITESGRTFQAVLQTAWQARASFFATCKEEETDCYRLLHGTVEGLAGLTIDRYGVQILIQTFHQALSPDDVVVIETFYTDHCSFQPVFVYNDRSANNSRRDNARSNLAGDRDVNQDLTCKEMGVEYRVAARHRGQDPLLFLDMRVGRRWMLAHARDKTVLNLFAYTCGIGICAALAGASNVWNIDYAKSALDFGQENADLNNINETNIRFIQSDCFPALKQLAGIPVKARQRRSRNGRPVKTTLPGYPVLPAKQFDIVFMDPPKWAKTPFGTVDLLRDYQSLFKPALLATKLGGRIVACNNLAKVDCDIWISQLIRCAEKAERHLSLVDLLKPEQDFPSFDDRPPLKIAVFKVSVD